MHGLIPQCTVVAAKKRKPLAGVHVASYHGSPIIQQTMAATPQGSMAAAAMIRRLIMA